MNRLKYFAFIFLIPFYSFSQEQSFEIFGKISGHFNSKMFLFFEDNYKQRDSLSSEIKDGKFYFKGNVRMPILARLHMDQTSLIADFYIDSNATWVNCDNKMEIHKNHDRQLDTLNALTITSVTGSKMDLLRSNFQKDMSPSYVKNRSRSGAHKQYEKLQLLIKGNPNSRVSAYLLSNASNLTYAEVIELNKLIDPSLENSFEGRSLKKLIGQLEKSPNSAAGALFHDFKLKDTSGVELDSRQYRGQYVLVVCWASWCGPCRMQHPELNDLYTKYKGEDFEMIGVSFDKDLQKWTAAIVHDKLYWKQVVDTSGFDGDLSSYYAIEGIPTSFLIDKEGKIVGSDMTVKEIEKVLRNGN